MHINFISGRSYQDLSQYLIFPWVLTDYTSDSLNLANEGVYRDFSKNMGTMGGEERTEMFKKRYE